MEFQRVFWAVNTTTPDRVFSRPWLDFMPSPVFLHKVERQPWPGYSFYGLDPLPALGSRLALLHHRRSGNHPKAPPRGSNAVTGGWVGQHYEHGCKGLLLAFLPPERRPGSVRHVGDSSQTAPRRGRAKLSPSPNPHHPAARAGGQVPGCPHERSDCGQCSLGTNREIPLPV